MDGVLDTPNREIAVDYFIFPLLKLSFLAMSALVLRLVFANTYHDFSLRMSMNDTSITHCVIHFQPYVPHIYLLIFPMFLLAISLFLKRRRLPRQPLEKILLFSPILLFCLHLLLTYWVDL